MRAHHVNGATMCPLGRRLVAGEGSVFARAELVCHCFVLETRAGLVLVETGLGTTDVAAPAERLPWLFRAYSRPRASADETLVHHLDRLGLDRRDVRHVALTHLDVDHAGGLSDFPDAAVHVSAAEHASALGGAQDGNAWRYVPAQWRHSPRWVVHPAGGERWFGFEGVRPLLPGVLEDEILLVPLAGHTRGHSGVAVRTDEGWLLHAGDAFFHREEIEGEERRCPVGLAVFQRILSEDNGARLENQARLRELARDPTARVRIVCSHDPVLLDRAAASAPTRTHALTTRNEPRSWIDRPATRISRLPPDPDRTEKRAG